MTESNTVGIIDQLRGQYRAVLPGDSMAEAGRKVLLKEFIDMLEHEAGSKLGADIEDIHQMRVATRRLRSAFRIFEPYYKAKLVRPFITHLKQTARALGAVRDFDVLIEDLQKVLEAGPEDAQTGLQTIIEHMQTKRAKAHAKLVKHLESADYLEFVGEFGEFLVTPGMGALPLQDHRVEPYQVRHVVPHLLQEYLSVVRAYDTVMPEATRSKAASEEPAAPLPEIGVLHQLRIEFKRLRYAMSFFVDAMGAAGESFISEIKKLQDHLGRLNDLYVFEEHIDAYLDDGLAESAVHEYALQLESERDKLEASLPNVWKTFNTRTVQSKFADALLALR